MLGGVLKFSILQKCVFILFFSVILIEYSGSVMGYSHDISKIKYKTRF